MYICVGQFMGEHDKGQRDTTNRVKSAHQKPRFRVCHGHHKAFVGTDFIGIILLALVFLKAPQQVLILEITEPGQRF